MRILVNDKPFKTAKQALNHINKLYDTSFTNLKEAKQSTKVLGYEILLGLHCPYCGLTGDACDFPDFIFDDEDNTKGEKEQYKLLEKLWKKGFNVVTCGHCGDVFIHELRQDLEDMLY